MERKYNKQPKLHIRKGDIVKVIAGDSKGSQGRVLEVLSATRKVLVEGVNLVTKHTKPNAKNTQGGIINATRVGRKEENGKLVRYSKKSGEVIK